MSVYVDKDRLLSALARALTQKIIPKISDPEARLEAESALGVIVRDILGHEDAPEVMRARARHLSDEVQGALSAAGERLAAEDTRKILAALDRDQATRTRAAETSSKLSKDFAAQQAARFPVPSEEQLTACLRRSFGNGSGRACAAAQMAGGNGKQTVSFDRVTTTGAVEALVMRRDIPDSFNRTTVVTEFPILKGLHKRGFPVPEPVWLDATNEVLQSPFMVTRRVPGRLAGDGKGAFPDPLFKPVEAFAEVLAQLHAIDPSTLDAAGISDAPWNEAALLGSVEYWERYYRDSVYAPVVAVDLAFGWLKRNARLGVQGPVLVHGEFGFHNVLVHEGRLTAVLDWELAHLGSPVEDLVYVKDQIERHCPFAEFVDLYVARGGPRPTPEAIEFYDVMRLARNAGLFGAAVNAFNKGTNERIPGTYLSSVLYGAYVKRLYKKMKDIVGEDRF